MQVAIIQSSTAPDAAQLMLAVSRAGMKPILCFSTAALIHFDGYILLDAPLQSDFLRQECAQGKPILGILKGAEFLVEHGYVPGLENDKPAILLKNNIISSSFLRASDTYQYNAFTRCLTKKDIFSVAKLVEKNFVIPPALLTEMQENGLNAFHFCDEKGVLESAIAAVSNKAGNVLAMLAELEFSEKSDVIFLAMREAILAGPSLPTMPLHYYPRK